MGWTQSAYRGQGWTIPLIDMTELTLDMLGGSL